MDMGRPWTAPGAQSSPAVVTRRSTRRASSDLETRKENVGVDHYSENGTGEDSSNRSRRNQRDSELDDEDDDNPELEKMTGSSSHSSPPPRTTRRRALVLSSQTSSTNTKSSVSQNGVTSLSQSKVENSDNDDQNKDEDEEDDDDPDHIEGAEGNGNDSTNSSGDSEEGDDNDSEHSLDDYPYDGAVRRSKRPRKVIQGSYNESWITGGGGAAKGYRRTSPAGCRRSIRHDTSRTDAENLDTETEDMYSRVKRRRTSFSGNGLSSTTQEKSRRTLPAKEEEPVSRRLRDRKKLSMNEATSAAFANSEPSKLDKLFRRKKRRQRRHRDSESSSSSPSSDDEGRLTSPTKKIRHRFGGDNHGKLQAKDLLKLMEVQPVAVDPSVNFKSIGGLNTFIDKLKEIVLFPLLYKEFYSQKGMKPPRGIMLHGPPGTGKTLLARALANECANINGVKVSFFLRKGADLLNKFVGESERQLRVLFQQAELHQPSIIFFDEIDGLAPVRSAKSDQIHNSIVSSLLAEIDGLQDRGQIIVMGSTNRLDFVDPALRRPGRFDCELPIFLPTRDGRREILNVHVSQWTDVVEEEMREELADRTIGFSGADLKFLCWKASMNSLRRTYPQIYSSTQKFLLNYNDIKVTKEDWEESLKTVTPSAHRSLFSSQVSAQPLPIFVKPLLQNQVDRALERIEECFPRHSIQEPSTKRLLITTEMDDSGLNSFIIPALLHKLEPLPVHQISYEGLHQDGVPPEFSVTQKCAEIMQQSSVCVCYIPAVDRLSRLLTDSSKQIIIRMLEQSLQKPILFIATVEGASPVLEEDEFRGLFDKYKLELPSTSTEEVRSFFKPVFEQASELKVITEKKCKNQLKPLPLAPKEVAKPSFTPEQLKALEKKENAMHRELRIFLREMLLKIVRNKKFEEFTKPVDIEEVPDYLNVIEHPMDFETMMVKLNQGDYLTARQFLDDIRLIHKNCLAYNPTTTESDKRLRMRAFELIDYTDKLFDREMDSDFEDECQKIIQSRAERNAIPDNEDVGAFYLSTTTTKDKNAQVQEQQILPPAQQIHKTQKGQKRIKRASNWARGSTGKKTKRTPVSSKESLPESTVPSSSTASYETSLLNGIADEDIEEETKNEDAMSHTSSTQKQSFAMELNSPLRTSSPKRTKSQEEDQSKQYVAALNNLLKNTVTFAQKYSQSVLQLIDLRFQYLKLVTKYQSNPDKEELVAEMTRQLKNATEVEDSAVQRDLGAKVSTPSPSPSPPTQRRTRNSSVASSSSPNPTLRINRIKNKD